MTPKPALTCFENYHALLSFVTIVHDTLTVRLAWTTCHKKKKTGIGKAIHRHMVVKLGLGEKEKEDREGRSMDEQGLQLSDQCLVGQCQGSKYVAKIR